jgi:sortase (surface protein transpeptidase)
MASPADFDAVGWYEEGAQPGMRGKAVLAGHVDNAAGRPAVFVRLTDVNPGDAIEVVGASGEVLTFIVSSLERYPYDDAPLARIFGPSENTELILITCDGTWQPFKRTYSDRLVVFAYLNNSGAE